MAELLGGAKILPKSSSLCHRVQQRHRRQTNDRRTAHVQLLSELIAKMKRGKAAGLDELSVEHLIYCHPAVVILLCKLFNFFVFVVIYLPALLLVILYQYLR